MGRIIDYVLEAELNDLSMSVGLSTLRNNLFAHGRTTYLRFYLVLWYSHTTSARDRTLSTSSRLEDELKLLRSQVS
jgi:hypothetical protein